jgi:hypothetical protein
MKEVSKVLGSSSIASQNAFTRCMVDLCSFAFILANLAACLLSPSIWMTFFRHPIWIHHFRVWIGCPYLCKQEEQQNCVTIIKIWQEHQVHKVPNERNYNHCTWRLGDGRVAPFPSCQSRFLMEAACVPHCLILDLKYTPNKHTYRLTLRHKAVDSQKRYQIVVVSSLTKCHHHVRVNK